MAYTIGWYQEGKVIESAFFGDVSIDEMRESSAKAIEMFAEGNPPIHFVTDLSQIKSFSKSFLEIRAALTYLEHPAMGWHAFYAAPPMSGSFINLYSQVLKVRVKSVRTREQALKFIAENDAAVVIHGTA